MSVTPPERVFYDGACGLCHRTVRWAVKADRRGVFRFAPLGGQTSVREIAPERRPGLPDSIVVQRADGVLLVRSDAVLHIAATLGGLWRAFAVAAGLVPRGLRDAVYDFVARVRSRVFAKPADACPVLSPELRARFDP